MQPERFSRTVVVRSGCSGYVRRREEPWGFMENVFITYGSYIGLGFVCNHFLFTPPKFLECSSYNKTPLSLRITTKGNPQIIQRLN